MELVGVRITTEVSVQLPTFPVSVVVEVTPPVQPEVNVVMCEATQVGLLQFGVDLREDCGLELEAGAELTTGELGALPDGVSTI